MTALRTVLSELKTVRCKSAGDIYISDLKPFIQKYALEHDLGLQLWDSGGNAARELAVRIIDPARVTERQLEQWVSDIEEWGICDAFAGNVVRPSKFAVVKVHKWAGRKETYQKRAAFAVMAQMAWQKNDFTDDVFVEFLALIEKHATDDRLHIKKAVNWALRDIGKRNENLRKYALVSIRRLQSHSDKTARWVGTHRIAEVMGV